MDASRKNLLCSLLPLLTLGVGERTVVRRSPGNKRKNLARKKKRLHLRRQKR